MQTNNLELGKVAEESAAKFLEKSGYRILKRNYRTRFAELDIIAKERGVICFVEVKARRTDRFGLPQEAVSRLKQLQISKAALAFLKENKLLEHKARFDVVSVSYCGNDARFNLIKDAFELDAQFTP